MIGPIFQRASGKLGAMMERQRSQRRPRGQHAIQRLPDRRAGHAGGHFKDRTLTTPLIDHGQHPKRSAIGQGIMHKVDAPPLGRPSRLRSWPTVQRGMLSRTHPRPLAVDRPAFPAEEHQDPQIPEPRAQPGDLADAEPQRHLRIALASAIPRRATELRQLTGPHARDAVGGLYPPGRLAALCGPQTFLRNASVRMCLSSDRSATRRFRRAFSSSSDRNCRSSATPQVGVLLLPDVERGLADADLAVDVRRRRAAFDLAEGIGNLLFVKLRLLHAVRPSSGDR